jgi:protein-tyrosine phosphatase
MAEVLDWQQGDPRHILQRALEAVTAGGLVGLPTDTGYHVACAALHADALAALAQLGPAEEAVLAVRGIADALRWAPWMSDTARRLARRCWPGPVTLVIEQHVNGEDVTQSVRLRVPAHEAPLLMLDQLDGPLVLLPVAATTAAQAAETLGEAVPLLISDDPPAAAPAPTVVHVCGPEWAVKQAGAITDDMLRALMPTTILFVCTGNTCRSPLAEALCKKLLADRLSCTAEELPGRGFLVLSAGLAAMMGSEASPEAVIVADECGARLAGHRSQPLTAELLTRADFLFTMTQSHLRALLPYCDPSGPQPRLLARDGGDVPDPIGAEQQIYRDCAQLILRHLNEWLPELRPAADEAGPPRGES